jgi:hypothetical protein
MFQNLQTAQTWALTTLCPRLQYNLYLYTLYSILHNTVCILYLNSTLCNIFLDITPVYIAITLRLNHYTPPLKSYHHGRWDLISIQSSSSCINPSMCFWYSVLPDAGLFQQKHVVTKLCVCKKHFICDWQSSTLSVFIMAVGWIKVRLVKAFA